MSDIKTKEDVLDLIKKEGIEVVDVRFMDFPACGSIFRFRPGKSRRTPLKTDWGSTVQVSGAGGPLMNRTCS